LADLTVTGIGSAALSPQNTLSEAERIIEVRIENARAPITWLKDPTRHLLKIKAVNAKDSSEADAQPTKPDEMSQGETTSQPRAE